MGSEPFKIDEKVYNITYTLTEHWSIEARVFLNTMFGEVMTQVCHKKIGHLDCDCRLIKVLTPLVLLYSSLELRSTIKRLLRDKFFD